VVEQNIECHCAVMLMFTKFRFGKISEEINHIYLVAIEKILFVFLY